MFVVSGGVLDIAVYAWIQGTRSVRRCVVAENVSEVESNGLDCFPYRVFMCRVKILIVLMCRLMLCCEQLLSKCVDM